MDKRKLGTFDIETGEILDEGVAIYVGCKVKVTENFFMMFQDALVELSKDRDLTGEHWRVLSYLFAKLDFENLIQVTQSEIAKELNIQTSHVSRSIKVLTDKKIIIRGPNIGRSSSFRLNPYFGWKGKVSNLKEAQKRHLELIK